MSLVVAAPPQAQVRAVDLRNMIKQLELMSPPRVDTRMGREALPMHKLKVSSPLMVAECTIGLSDTVSLAFKWGHFVFFPSSLSEEGTFIGMLQQFALDNNLTQSSP